MATIAQNFALTGSQVTGLLALLLVAAMIGLLGAAAAGRQRLGEADLVCGWAVISTVFTIIGAANLLSFTTITYVLLGAAVAAAAILHRRGATLFAPGMVKMLMLGIPLIVLVAAMAPSQWDEFTNWLPNVRYLFDNDTFPRAGLPKSASVFGAYPYGLPLVIYMTSRLAGALVENAGAMFNLLLLLGFGVFTARLIRAGAGGEVPSGHERLSWRWCAFGALAVTLLSPTFVTKLVFSAYSDAGTAVALGFATGLGWLMLEALERGDSDRARSLAWQAGLALAALVNIRQPNLVLFVALLAAVFIVALRDPGISVGALLKLLPRLVILPVVVYGAWRLHVNFNITGGEFGVRPMDDWLVHLAPDILARMALIASKKGGYFGLMTVAVVAGAYGLVRMRGSFDRLAVIAACLFGAYNLFLLFAYVAAYDQYEAARAAGYWRYNTHLGLVALLFGAYGGALIWHRRAPGRLRQWLGSRRTAAAVIVLIVALPVAMSSKLRFDIDWRKTHARAVGMDLAAMLPASARLMTIDTNDNGQYLVIVRYAMYGAAPIVGSITAHNKASARGIRSMIEKRRASHVWIHQATAAVDQAFGLKLDRTSSHLLTREDGPWKAARSWSYPAASRNR